MVFNYKLPKFGSNARDTDQLYCVAAGEIPLLSPIP